MGSGVRGQGSKPIFTSERDFMCQLTASSGAGWGQLDIITSLPGLLRVGGGGVARAASSVHGDSSDPPADGGLMFWVLSAQTHVPHPAGSASSEGGQRAP